MTEFDNMNRAAAHVVRAYKLIGPSPAEEFAPYCAV